MTSKLMYSYPNADILADNSTEILYKAADVVSNTHFKASARLDAPLERDSGVLRFGACGRANSK